jgi:glycosyltransferase involved in cell wall biosynthesis
MACGTPVLGFRGGSVAEVIDEGVTGMIVDNFDQAVVALPHVVALDRRKVRRRFEARFSASRMARDYVGLYRRLLRAKSRASPDLRYSSNGSVRVKRTDLGITDVETHVE